MGSASLDLTTLDLGKTTDLTLCLQDPSRSSAQLGEIVLSATLFPKSQEDKEQVINCYTVFLFSVFCKNQINVFLFSLVSRV